MNKTCLLCLKRQTLWIYGFETPELNKTLFRSIEFAQKDYQCKKRYNIGSILNHLLNLFSKGVAKYRWYVFYYSFFIIILFSIISTEGALIIPMTYDNHPIPSIHPVHPQSLLNHLNRPWIDLSWPPMTSNDLQ